MDVIFQAKTYRDIVEQYLRGEDAQRRKGVSALAAKLKCHPTFIAKVLSGRGEFSVEQALAFCDCFTLSDFETQYFVDLVQRDRAGDKKTKLFFETKLQSMRETRLELSRRLGDNHKVQSEIRGEYYSSWIVQYVHIYCQLPGKHTVASIAQRARVSESVIEAAVQLLLKGGILSNENGRLRSVVDFIHLPRDSYLVANMHKEWRMKAASDVAQKQSENEIRFSGLMSIDKETAYKVKELLTLSLSELKTMVSSASSSEVFFLGIDFYEPCP